MLTIKYFCLKCSTNALPALIFNDCQEVKMSWQDKHQTFQLLNFEEKKMF